jgi:hypothetical protein
MIFDIEINEQDQPSFKNTPKQLYSYIKSQLSFSTLPAMVSGSVALQGFMILMSLLTLSLYIFMSSIVG